MQNALLLLLLYYIYAVPFPSFKRLSKGAGKVYSLQFIAMRFLTGSRQVSIVIGEFSDIYSLNVKFP